MHLDAAGKWLYVADPGNARILRMDVTSATCPGADIKSRNEWRELYKEYSLCHGQKMESLYLSDIDVRGIPTGLTLIPDGLLFSTRNDGQIHFIRPTNRDFETDMSGWKQEREIHTGSHKLGALT